MITTLEASHINLPWPLSSWRVESVYPDRALRAGDAVRPWSLAPVSDRRRAVEAGLVERAVRKPFKNTYYRLTAAGLELIVKQRSTYHV